MVALFGIVLWWTPPHQGVRGRQRRRLEKEAACLLQEAPVQDVRSVVQRGPSRCRLSLLHLLPHEAEAQEPKRKRVSCKNTIMSKAEKKRPAFLKPRVNDFDRTGFKRVKKAKVFGTTTSDGQSLIRPCPLHPPGLIG